MTDLQAPILAKPFDLEHMLGMIHQAEQRLNSGAKRVGTMQALGPHEIANTYHNISVTRSA